MVSHPSIVLRKHLLPSRAVHSSLQCKAQVHRVQLHLGKTEFSMTPTPRCFDGGGDDASSGNVNVCKQVMVCPVSITFVNFVSVFFATFDPKLFDSHINESIRSDKVNFQLQFGRFEMCERI